MKEAAAEAVAAEKAAEEAAAEEKKTAEAAAEKKAAEKAAVEEAKAKRSRCENEAEFEDKFPSSAVVLRRSARQQREALVEAAVPPTPGATAAAEPAVRSEAAKAAARTVEKANVALKLALCARRRGHEGLKLLDCQESVVLHVEASFNTWRGKSFLCRHLVFGTETAEERADEKAKLGYKCLVTYLHSDLGSKTSSPHISAARRDEACKELNACKSAITSNTYNASFEPYALSVAARAAKNTQRAIRVQAAHRELAQARAALAKVRTTPIDPFCSHHERSNKAPPHPRAMCNQ